MKINDSQFLKKVNDTIRPETPLERTLLTDPDLLTGLAWGKPRPGHPEGEVLSHVREVLDNVDKVSPEKGEVRSKLRFIAIVHDSLKYQVDRSRPRFGENHHAMKARRVAERYTEDKDILDIIELHDEAYNAWQTSVRRGRPDVGRRRAIQLIERLGDNIDLFLLFYLCDHTEGKNDDDMKWFKEVTMEEIG
jgi:hypothetical protein